MAHDVAVGVCGVAARACCVVHAEDNQLHSNAPQHAQERVQTLFAQQGTVMDTQQEPAPELTRQVCYSVCTAARAQRVFGMLGSSVCSVLRYARFFGMLLV